MNSKISQQTNAQNAILLAKLVMEVFQQIVLLVKTYYFISILLHLVLNHAEIINLV